jgi:hypothetical protein
MLSARDPAHSLLRPSTLSDTDLANMNIILIGFVKTQRQKDKKKSAKIKFLVQPPIVLFSVRESDLKYQTTFLYCSVEINCVLQKYFTHRTFFDSRNFKLL